jgi:hypothetical protein
LFFVGAASGRPLAFLCVGAQQNAFQGFVANHVTGEISYHNMSQKKVTTQCSAK